MQIIEIHWIYTVRNDTEMFFKVLIILKGAQRTPKHSCRIVFNYVCILYSRTA